MPTAVCVIAIVGERGLGYRSITKDALKDLQWQAAALPNVVRAWIEGDKLLAKIDLDKTEKAP